MPRVMVLLLRVAVMFVGLDVVLERLTIPENPPTLATVIVTFLEVVAFILRVPTRLVVIVKSGGGTVTPIVTEFAGTPALAPEIVTLFAPMAALTATVIVRIVLLGETGVTLAGLGEMEV